jgi:membrane-associated protein
MIPGVDLIDFITTAGVIGIVFVIFAESGLLFGFFLPGDTLLFSAGFLTQAGVLPVNIHLLVLLVFIAAVTGDSVGYTFGRRVGRKLYNRPNSRLFKQAHLEKAEEFYKKYGGKTIILARFVPAVRTFAPIVAGASKMPYATFLTYNIIGALIWAVGVTYLGYYLGAWFESMGLSVDHVLLPMIALILLISIIPAIVHLARNKKQRDALLLASKKQLDTLFRRK